MGKDSESGEGSVEELEHKLTAGLSAKGKNGSIHKCSYKDCKAVFKRPYRLEQHVRVHTGERPYKCTRKGCDKTYTRPSHLKRHKLNSHKAQPYIKTVRCPYPGCLREFTSESNIRRHYCNIHESNVFRCETCGEKFDKRYRLHKHMYGHTGVYNFRCSQCEEGFVTVRELNRHKRKHRTYPCTHEGCDKVFEVWTQLLRHIRLEHVQIFSCAHCDKEFKNRSRLRDHVRTHTEDREVIRCPYEDCSRNYYDRRNLNHHIRVRHEGLGFECTHPGCVQKLSSKRCLVRHMKLHDSNRPVPRKKKKGRTPRKDKGIPKTSMAVRLSGLIVSPQQEKKILEAECSTVNDINSSQQIEDSVVSCIKLENDCDFVDIKITIQEVSESESNTKSDSEMLSDVMLNVVNDLTDHQDNGKEIDNNDGCSVVTSCSTVCAVQSTKRREDVSVDANTSKFREESCSISCAVQSSKEKEHNSTRASMFEFEEETCTPLKESESLISSSDCSCESVTDSDTSSGGEIDVLGVSDNCESITVSNTSSGGEIDVLGLSDGGEP